MEAQQKGVFMKCAHAEGRGGLCYTPDGRHILTCGEDTFVKIFEADNLDAEPRTLEHHDAPVTALAIDKKGQHFATGTDAHLAEYFSYPAGTFERNLTRMQSAVRHIAFDNKGRNVAVAGDDASIRFVNLTIKQFSTLKGHTDSVLCVAFDPLGDYLASSSADGTVRIWDMRDEPKTVKTIQVCGRVPAGSAQQLRVAWHPTGESLAVPRGNGIQVLSRALWEVEVELTGGHTKEVTLLAWSANGRYLCSGGMDKQHFLWDVSNADTLDRHKAENLSCDLMWSPNENAIALLDDSGLLGVWRQPVPSHYAAPFGDAEKPSQPAASTATMSAASSTAPKPTPATSKAASASAPPPAPATAAAEAARSEVAPDDDDLDADLLVETAEKSNSRRRLKKVVHDSDDGGFSDHDDDEAAEAAMLAEQLKRHGARALGEFTDGLNLNAARVAAAALAATPAAAPPQEVLHPSSTPEKNGRRFLLWNLTGMVLSRDENTYHAIEVDFNDAERHRTMRLTDHYGFSMAALDDAAVIFASKSNHGNPSTVVYRPLTSWAPNSDWQVQFEKGEEALAVALGHKFAAVATSSRYLRIFSHTGAPRSLLCFPHQLVALAAADGLLVLVQHAGRAATSDDQSMLLSLFDLREPGRPVRVCNAPLPLSAGATLSWIGFSERSALSTVDSCGVVRQCVRSAGFEWMPLLQAESIKKSKSEHHWVVGLTATQLMCVICKGEDKFPATLPRPVLSALALNMPLACSEPAEPHTESARLHTLLQLDESRLAATEKGVEDEDETRAQLLRTVQSMDSHTLRLFATACKSERNARALDLAVQMQLPKTVAAALKLANHFKLGPLSERVTRLLEAKHDNVQMDGDLEVMPARRQQTPLPRSSAPVKGSNGASAATDAAEAEPARSAVQDDSDGENVRPEEDEDGAAHESTESAGPKPVLNPFAKASQQVDGAKNVLPAGDGASKTPGTLKGSKRKGVTFSTSATKKQK